MRSFLRIAVIAAGGLLVVACAGQSTIFNDMLSGGYRPYVFGYAAGRRDLTTIIVGNPFKIEKAEARQPAGRDAELQPELPAADPLHHHPWPERRPGVPCRIPAQPTDRVAGAGLPGAGEGPGRRPLAGRRVLPAGGISAP
jgi:hypothetical protein